MRDMIRFGKKWKWSPRYVGFYEIMKWVWEVAYVLDFSLEMTMVNLVFHVSILRKFVGYPSPFVPLEEVGVEENLTYENMSIEILDR